MIREGLTFDDVLLLPRKSRVFSRKDISTKTQLSKNISLNTPIVSANMDTVTESKMARAMAEAGGIGIIHRFLSIERQAEEVHKVKRAENIIIEEPVTAEPTESIFEVKERIKKEGVSNALVVKEKNGRKFLVGILTSRDLLFENDNSKTVASLMTTDLVTAHPNVSLKEAKDILHKYRVEKLPLVSDSGELKGLITLKDILKKMDNPNASKDKKGRLLVGAAVGVKDDTLERAKALVSAGADAIVIDIAHGHNFRVIETLKMLKKNFKNTDIIAGNIATKEAALDLIKAGADALKVGIGPGAACTTRVVTGVGVPQLTAIMDVVSIAKKYNVPVIADGGIKSSGHFAKALAAGAQTAMIGNLLAGCKESPGEYIIDRGVIYKNYRGMASYDAASDKKRLDSDSGDGFFRSPEGASGRISFRGEANMVLTDLMSGLRSSMSYLGAKDLKTFVRNAEFIKMTQSGMVESGPHGVKQ
ncbi:IMP dehydrogenase [Candidatus Azambacteria bacterium]|nr:IMP dehydrogenase [Candidatus Azambacteria bacterium]